MRLVPLVFVFACISCNYNPGTTTIVYDTIPETEIISGDSISMPVNYKGRIPCADCAAIDMDLTFYPDSLKYHLKETYLETPDGDRSLEYSGNYILLNDTIHASGIYRLNPDSEREIRNFKVEEEGLRILDKDMQPVESSADYLLRISETVRVPEQNP